MKNIIRNAYDAYWFLYNHPQFMVQHRTEITPEHAEDIEAKGYLVTRDPSGKCYRVFRHSWQHAMDTNLDIHYTKTNGTQIDENPKKNKHVECWLEFGRSYYGFVYSGSSEEPNGDYDTDTMLHNSHNPDLDTGGATFDEALIKLARLVKKHYGDYSPRVRKQDCGKPVCGDCEENKALSKRMFNK